MARFQHFDGVHPESAALRILLANAGVAAPDTDAPFTEAMVFGIAGGIGAGAFSFNYAAEGVSTFFVAGRHLWYDSRTYVEKACERFGVEATFRESSGARTAAEDLRKALDSGPVAAWVEMALLPHRGMPADRQGGGYHVVTVYELDSGAGRATIGDLSPETYAIDLDDLAAARERIKSQKNRLLSIKSEGTILDLRSLVREGVAACADGLSEGRIKNFTLESFKVWADRLFGAKGKDAWDRAFPRGGPLWSGLSSVHEFIDHYHTGGGLMRNLYSQFLSEAGRSLNDRRLVELSAAYADLGRAWSEIADAALPDGVPLFEEAKALMRERSGRAASSDQLRWIWSRLDEIGRSMNANFPLTEDESRTLLAGLQRKVRSVYERELAARDGLAAWAS